MSKKKRPIERMDRDEAEARIGRFFRYANNTTDEHALILPMAAYLEECLKRLLQAYFREGQAKTELLNGAFAPLGTFSAKIKICYVLGLLTDEQYRNLEDIKDIRNRFAHRWDGCSLSDDYSRSRVNRLRYNVILKDHEDLTLDQKLKSGAGVLATEIESATVAVAAGQHKRSSFAVEVVPMSEPVVGDGQVQVNLTVRNP